MVGTKAKVKTKAKKDSAESAATDSNTSESDATDSDDDTSTDNNTSTTTASNGCKAVLESYEHLLALACDAQSDWSSITSEMAGVLKEEIASRLVDNAARVLRNKEWEAN